MNAKITCCAAVVAAYLTCWNVGVTFGTPAEVGYVGKYDGRDYLYTERDDQICIKFSDNAGASASEEITNAAGFRLIVDRLQKHRFGVYAIPSGRDFVSARELLEREEWVVGVLPVYTSQYGDDMYFDPEWLLVKFIAGTEESEAQDITASRRSTIVADYGGGLYMVTVPAGLGIFDAVTEFAASAKVMFAEPRSYTFDHILTDTYLGDEWNLENVAQEPGYTLGNDIEAFPAWNFTYGSSDVVLAILDTGIDLDHPDLTANILDRNGRDWNWIDPGLSEPIDAWGHGTQVAGIAAAVMNDIGVRGVAPGIKIMPLKVAADTSVDNLSVYQALQEVMFQAPNYDAIVVNCSFGGTTPNQLIHQKMDQLSSNGILVVCAAGNKNVDSVEFPAGYASTIAVGAMAPCDEVRKRKGSDPLGVTCDGEWWWGSNFGDMLDVAAPGVKLYTTDMVYGGYNTGIEGDLPDLAYSKLGAGTSLAGPQVAALAALVLSLNPSLSTEALRVVLHNSSDKVGGYDYMWDEENKPGHSLELGYGRINVYKALKSVQLNAEPVSVAGFEEGEVTWPSSGYFPNVYVHSDVYFSLGSQLTIEPGTTVYFAPGTKLNMFHGELVADASGGDPIVFTSDSEAPEPGDWNGIGGLFNLVTMKNCVVSCSEIGLSVSGVHAFWSGKSVIENVTFEDNLTSQLNIFGFESDPAWVEVKDCLFDVESPYGIWIQTPAESVTVRDCSLYGSLAATYGIFVDNDFEFGSGGPTLVGNGIYEFDAGKGVYLTGGSTSILDGNVIWDPKWGIYCEGESQSVVNSESAQAKIIHCTTGLYVKDTAAPVVSNVSFENCTKYAVDATWQAGLDLGGGAGGSPGLNSFLGTCGRYKHVNVPYRDPYLGPVMAESNWWGSDPPNPGCISVGTVDYTPWLSYDPNPAGDGGPVTMDLVRPVPSAWQNYPNPFRTATTIAFDVPNAGARVKVRVFDSEGRLIRSLFDGPGQAGRQEIRWDGRNDDGRQMPAGVYFCNIEIGRDYSDQKKMILGR